MNELLTTITPYWGRPEMLRTWITAMAGASHRCHHIVLCIGEPVPAITRTPMDPRFRFISLDEVPGTLSIGHYHNVGAKLAETEWIMKLDVDTVPHVDYFKSLIPFLETAPPKSWFNGGMIYLNPASSAALSYPVPKEEYHWIMLHRRGKATGYQYPSATNFICRTADYLGLGGCDERFRGWGWEDYQQIYALERNQLGKDPLGRGTNLLNVTQRCRDLISRPKAKQLWEECNWLCLLHRWHPKGGGLYKNAAVSAANRKILFEYVERFQKT